MYSATNSKRTIAAVCLAVLLAGCASKPPASEGVQNARRSVPAGVLVAIATAWDAMTSFSEAEVQLILAMTFMTQNMIDEAVAAGEIATGAAQALIRDAAAALSKSPLNGAVRHGQGVGQGDIHWTVMYMEKAEVVGEINRALALALLTAPDTEGFSIDSRIDEEFQRAAASEWTN